MGLIEIENVTHWSIPVNNLREAEWFYGELLGLTLVGRLSNSVMTCFSVGQHNILLCERELPMEASDVDQRVHHSFTVTPEMFVRACNVFADKHIPVLGLVYRGKGHFTGRELYFHDPSGNRLELRDPTWQEGMSEPSLDDIVESARDAG